MKTDVFPKSSCNKISNKITKSECLGHCILTTNIIAMISHDESTSTCMCCSDISGDHVRDPNWKSFVPRKCKFLFFYQSFCVSKLKLSLLQQNKVLNHQHIKQEHSFVCFRAKQLYSIKKFKFTDPPNPSPHKFGNITS